MSDRVLIVILCETRGFSLTFDRFQKNLVDITHADLALCVSENDREDPTNPFYQNAKYLWKSREFEDWGEGIEELRHDCHPQWRTLDRVPVQWLGSIKTKNPHPGSGGIVFYFREFLRACLRDSDVLEKYDRFILTRSDFVHEIPHVPLRYLDPNYVWVPDGEHYRGITDRHVICPAGKIDAFLSVCDIFTETPDKIIAELSHEKAWNPEQILKRHIGKTGLEKDIRFFPYTMYAVRESTGHTSWSFGQFKPEIGAFVKYESEYQRARLARLICGKSGWSTWKITLFNVIHRPFDWIVNKVHFTKLRFAKPQS